MRFSGFRNDWNDPARLRRLGLLALPLIAVVWSVVALAQRETGERQAPVRPGGQRQAAGEQGTQMERSPRLRGNGAGQIAGRVGMRGATVAQTWALTGQTSLSFQAQPPDATGLGPIMRQWRQEENALGGQWIPWGVTLFDYDNDGDVDMLISQHSEARTILVRNQLKETGSLTFINATSAVGLKARQMPVSSNKPVVWDFDGDGRLDVADFPFGARGNCVWNKSDTRWEVADFSFRPLALPPNESPLEIRDMNGDGYPDLVSATAGEGGLLFRFIYQPGSRDFRVTTAPMTSPPTGVPQQLVDEIQSILRKPGAGEVWLTYFTDYDLNGDGLNDVVALGYGPYGAAVFGRYCLAQPSGPCVESSASLGLPQNGAPILVRDLNGDGLVDVLVGAAGAASGVYWNQGSGRFLNRPGESPELTQLVGDTSIGDMRVARPADFDNDGDLDLVISLRRSGVKDIYENTGSGFRLVMRATTSWSGSPEAIGDLNNDGRLDVVIGGPGGEEVTVLLNTTSNPGNYVKLYPRMDAPNPFAAGARITVYPPSGMAGAGVRPLLAEWARPDGLPLHLGLGTRTGFDVAVRYPGGRIAEIANASTQPDFVIRPGAQGPDPQPGPPPGKTTRPPRARIVQ